MHKNLLFNDDHKSLYQCEINIEVFLLFILDIFEFMTKRIVICSVEGCLSSAWLFYNFARNFSLFCCPHFIYMAGLLQDTCFLPMILKFGFYKLVFVEFPRNFFEKFTFLGERACSLLLTSLQGKNKKIKQNICPTKIKKNNVLNYLQN